jgi:hypothetical protein
MCAGVMHCHWHSTVDKLLMSCLTSQADQAAAGLALITAVHGFLLSLRYQSLLYLFFHHTPICTGNQHGHG